MKTRYMRATTPDEVWVCLAALQVKTVVFDVEPLVAFWDTDQHSLDDGIASVLAAAARIGPNTVIFATNSARTPTMSPTVAWAAVRYLTSARKPLRVNTFQDLP